MTIPNIHLQPRCHTILDEFVEVGGILDLPTIAERHYEKDKTGRSCRRRMQLWSIHGLVEHLTLAVISSAGRRGRLPTVLRLLRRGAELYEHETGKNVAQQPARRPPRPETVLHRVGMAKTQLIVNDACALHGLPKPVWIHERTTYPDLAQKLEQRKKQKDRKSLPATDRFILYERFALHENGTNRNVTCWPDASCLLSIPLQDGTIHPLILDWEYDRSTMQLSDIAAKMPGFEMKYTTGSYARHWPQASNPTIRILFVVPSIKRLRHLAQEIKKSPAAKLVRVTTVADLSPATFFSAIWRTADEEHRPMVGHPLPGSALCAFIHQTAEKHANADLTNWTIPEQFTREACAIIESFCATDDRERVAQLARRSLRALIAQSQPQRRRNEPS